MAQSRALSLVEAVTNVVVGFGIAVGVQLVIFPVYGLAVRFTDTLGIGAVFTLVSIVRSYIVRRLFERIARAGP